MAKSVRIEGAGPSFPLKMEARLNVMEIALISVVQIGGSVVGTRTIVAARPALTTGPMRRRPMILLEMYEKTDAVVLNFHCPVALQASATPIRPIFAAQNGATVAEMLNTVIAQPASIINCQIIRDGTRADPIIEINFHSVFQNNMTLKL